MEPASPAALVPLALFTTFVERMNPGLHSGLIKEKHLCHIGTVNEYRPLGDLFQMI